MIVLQKFGFKDSRYERPQDNWICGRLADGNPCELGPGLDGRCCVTTVCQPRLENDRWQCRRAANAGGPCGAGPFPDGRCCIASERCVPRRSLRSKRRRTAVACVALMIGLVGAIMGGKEGRHFMMPGALSSHHAGLTDCSSCHSGARSGQVDLLHRLMTAVEPRQNSNLCLTCHVMGAQPFAPHTHAVDDLERRSEALRIASKDWKPEGLMQRIAFPATVKSRGTEAEIQCSTCHREHQGVFANLKTVSNQRCQTCHVSRFGSFADSHPQFVRYPYQRRPRIAFDHQSHMTKHFPEALKAAVGGQIPPDNCSDCHQLGVRQRLMEVKPFATICAGCHGADITGATQVSGPKGIDVLAVPGLDVATLDQRGVDIGGWPDKSEAVLTPYMKLLLDAETNGAASGVAGLDLLDLRKANDQELERVARLAWAVKRLFNRLENTNPSNLKLLAKESLGAQIDHDQMAALTGGMSRDVILAGNREWFPGLKEELQRHDRGETTRAPAPTAKRTTDVPKSSPPPSAKSANGGPKSPGPDILGGSAGKQDDILSSGEAAASGKKDDILSKDDKSDILAPPKQDDILAAKKDDILTDKPASSDILSNGGDAAASPLQNAPDADARKTISAPAQFDPEVWAQSGGWYRQDFTIRYRPTGHADQFLQTWLDFAGSGYGTILHERLAPIFDTLSSKDAVGRCTKCHSIDDQKAAKVVNWLPFDPNALKNRFTNYSHKPHVELIGAKTGAKACVRCHELQSVKTDFMKTYDAGDPTSYTSNFKPLDKAVCASCHSQQTAWENCTLCHGYHVLEVNTKPRRQIVSASVGSPTQPAINAAIDAAMSSPDTEEDPDRDYAMAEALGTNEAWAGFVAQHPSGHYHDLAVQQIARLSKPAPAVSDPGSAMPPVKQLPDRQPVDSDQSKAAAPDRPGEATADKSMPPAAGDAKQAKADNSMKAALSDKLAAVTTDLPPRKPLAIEEPTDPAGFLRRGDERALHGEFELARRDFDEVIRREPQNAAALNDRCWVSALLDEVRTALEDCNASLRAAPNFADALDSRGLVNLKLGFYKKAIADYNAALSQFRGAKRASALYGRGMAKRRIGSLAGAQTDIDAAKVLRPAIVEEFASYGIR